MIAARPFTRGEGTMLATTAICTAMVLVTSLAFSLDERLLRGANVWSKPVKFAVSFGLHLATLLIFVRLVSNELRKGWLVATTLVAGSTATLIEVFYVAVQSARGRASHFNTETAWESFMYYQVMGGASLVIVAATVVVGFLVLRHARPDIGPGLRLGAGWGAILSAIATLAVAGALASGAISGPGPWIGEPRSDANGLPIVGWSRETGDLRVSHFVATHLIQAMALAGWFADRLFSRAGHPYNVRSVVGAVAIIGIVLTVATFAQAVRGWPLLPIILLPVT